MGLIRLCKKWNKTKKATTIPSYILETLIINYCENVNKLSERIDVRFKDALLYISQNISKQINDMKGISDSILLDTLADIPRWLDTWSDLKGEMFLGELEWLKKHMELKLFKLGRLQFCFADDYKFPKRGIRKGDTVIDTHIPADGPLLPEECIKSFDYAREFFEKYYPEYKYEVFTCHSWLLDENLTNLLDENSNIVKFQKLFTIECQHKSDAILGYTFRWKVKRE